MPKVIDFGVAKATGQRLTDKTLFTKFQQLLGTPAYMSPEQAEMTSVDIDTRSDIYSLGVLLYELLTARVPFDTRELLRAGMEAMLRTIREQDPVRPSARLSTLTAIDQTTVAQQRQIDAPKLINLLRGDLDWIVMKCLEKDRARRYETANGLMADVYRHLTNEPVLARPPSNLYRMHKTVRRHKLAFAAAAAVLASFLLGPGSTTTMFFKKQGALREAEAVHAEVAQQKSEVDRKNTELRAMLVEAARSDRLIAKEKLRLGQKQLALAHLARACEYDPSSALAAEMGIAALGSCSHGLLNTILVGHTKRVKTAQFSPDGKHIVTASADKTACVWDVARGQILVTLAGHTGEVSSAQFSPDGTRIVTAGRNDMTVRLWDADSGKLLRTLAGLEGEIHSVQFSSDGSRIVSVSWSKSDCTARVWDASTGKALATLAGHQAGVWSAHLSSDGKHIVTASDDKTVRVSDVPQERVGAPPEWFPDFLRYVAQVQLNPDGEFGDT